MPEERVETEWIVDVPDGYAEGARLDVYLTRAMMNATRSKVQQGIREGRVEVNGTVVRRVSQTVSGGDRIRCRILRPPPIHIAPEPLPLDVVFEDDWVIVVDKAAGMVVHPAYGHRTGTLVNALLHHVGASAYDQEDVETDDEAVGLSTAAARRGADPSVRPGIIHRLDKDTSGLMVVARRDEAHAHIAAQFEQRTVDRAYRAIVWGHPEPGEGRVEAAVGRSRSDRKKMAVVPAARGRWAATRYEVVERHEDTSLVTLRLESGRTHQIRVHMAHLGHPVFGDATYGGDRIRHGADTRLRRQTYRNLFALLPRQALHAELLGFDHPHSGQRLRFESPLPPDFAGVLDALRASPRR